MNELYTAVMGVSCLALVTMTILVHQNGRVPSATKKRFYETYAALGMALIAEWLGVMLNGAPEWTRGLHSAAKLVDYIITPVASVLFVRQIVVKNRYEKLMTGLLAANAVFQLISVFTGWTYYLDEANIYRHGPLYVVYMALFILAVLYVFYSFLVYGRQQSRQNRMSLYAVVVLVLVGIALQEIVSSNLRTANLTLVMCSMLMFIHYSEFVQMRKDDEMSEQKRLLETDPLTGMLSRYAYNLALNRYAAMPVLPPRLVVFAADMNGLKEANDRNGHEAGDELICGAAECIAGVVAGRGSIYRTGGDEFVIMAELDQGAAEEMCSAIGRSASAWHGKLNESLSFSVGYALACEHAELSIERLINLADQQMYAEKARYYQQNGIDRRRHRAPQA